MLLDFVAASVRPGQSTWQLTVSPGQPAEPDSENVTAAGQIANSATEFEETAKRAADEVIPSVAEVAETFGWLPKLLASFATGKSSSAGRPNGPLQPKLPLRSRIHESIVQFGRETIQIEPAGASSTQCVSEMNAALRLQMIDPRGRKRTVRFNQIAVETDGRVRSTVCLTGRIPRSGGLNVQMRLTFYAKTGLMRLAVKLHNPNRARHSGGLWDLGDRGSRLFKAFFIELDLGEDTGTRRLNWTTETNGPCHSSDAGQVHIYQDSSGGENWNSRNHVNRDGRIPCRFRGYRTKSPHGIEEGLRANPTLTVEEDELGSLAVAVPEFWQQFPKSLETDGRFLRIGLFPKEWDDLFELQGGEQKTHEVWLRFGGQNDSLTWIHSPVRVTTPPTWNETAGAFSCLVPSCSEASDRVRDYLAEALAGEHSLESRRETVDEYGWRHFGDLWADHEQAYCDGPKPVMSHYNNQFDLIYGAILQLARTGDTRWFDLFDPLARHVIDIDIYHTTHDRSAYNGGLFWHTDHYVDAATSTHRSYTRQNQKPGLPYGGGPSDEHNYTTGLLYYYYLTGNLDARDAVLSLADWVLSMDDGRLALLGAVDPEPTGLASATGSPCYHGPGRGAGNSVNALLDAWLISGQQKYLDYAEHLIQRVVHPCQDIESLDLLNAEARWSYTVFLSVLAKYLSLKSQSGQTDSMYAYAAQSLRHFGRWMVENERPYFDHPEQLEYPTETWAAQEMRKANVLRLAAAYAEDDERDQMLRRGNELAERAWSDLYRFDSKYVARAFSIMMSEGARDSYFASGRLPATQPHIVGCDTDCQAFVPQKQRVFRDVRTFKGAIRMSVRLLNPRFWPNLLRAVISQL